MPRETEIKLRIEDVKALRRALKQLRARTAGERAGRIHEWNVVYDTPEGGLARHGQLLRVRTETPQAAKKRPGKTKERVVLTFKQPAVGKGEFSGDARRLAAAGRHKVREEVEVEVADGASLGKILEGLGMRGWFRYEKYRTTMTLSAAVRWARGLLIELDETPIGTFVELEGPPEAIDQAAEELGFQRKSYILKSYLALYLDHCRERGEEPHDMLFGKK